MTKQKTEQELEKIILNLLESERVTPYQMKNKFDVDIAIKDIKTLISQERAEAKKEARMELEVEIGLEKFGQLMKEKEKIRAEAVRGFVKHYHAYEKRMGLVISNIDENEVEQYLKLSQEKHD